MKTRMLRIALTALTALACLAVAPPAGAQMRKNESANFALTAQIDSIDAKAKTLTLKGANGESGVYVVNDQTTIMSGDKKIGFADLKKGWRLAVNGDNSSGKNVATYLEVVETETK